MPSSSHLLDTKETKVSHPGLDAQHHSAPRINSRVTEPHHTKQGYSVGSATLNPAVSRTQVPSYPGKCSGPLSYRMQHTPQKVVVADNFIQSNILGSMRRFLWVSEAKPLETYSYTNLYLVVYFFFVSIIPDSTP